MEIREQVVEILAEMGICVPDEGDINLYEYLGDSIQYINFILEVETAFGIEIPDAVLGMESVTSLTGFANMINDIINGDVEWIDS